MRLGAAKLPLLRRQAIWDVVQMKKPESVSRRQSEASATPSRLGC